MRFTPFALLLLLQTPLSRAAIRPPHFAFYYNLRPLSTQQIRPMGSLPFRRLSKQGTFPNKPA
jgi:hypothetical protein